ncbi:MAG: CHAT domain-containing protein [Spirulina sp. SIO3F2]|nr:CHAT domain-containing protein [Spirulina sp. SIO3F2]
MQRQLVTQSLVWGILWGVGFNLPTMAQNITPANDGTGTVVNVQGSDRFTIQGGSLSGDGQNLFHSFEQFGLDTNQIADFLTQPQIQNVLGRVVGGNPSFINGVLQVSGSSTNLYLMNPAGIVFGSGASLNVGGDFVATTADAIGFGDSQWFNATGSNNYQTLVGNPNLFAFDRIDPGAIVNSGTLHPSGNLTVLAGAVVNTGELSANTVTVQAIPDSALIRLSQPDHLLSLEVLPPRDAQGNVGAIAPLDLPSLLTGSPVSLAAETIAAIEPGTTWAAGTIHASEVNLLGEQVAVLDTITTPTGGSVRIGGDYLGNGPIPNAARTYIDPQATINADQGQVVVWSDDVTRFFGTINAPGGFVETSSKDHLEVVGSQVVAADWLLDPFNVTIGAVASGTFNTSGVNPVIFEAASNDAIIDVATILGTLAVGTSVAINTGVAGTQAGNITVAAAINPTALGGGPTLTLTAANDITVNAAITNADIVEDHFLNVELFAGGNIDVNAAIATGGGKIEARTTGGNIDTTGITLNASDLRTNGNNAQGGNVILNATGTIATGAINTSATTTVGGDATAGAVTLTAADSTTTATTTIATSATVAGGTLITTTVTTATSSITTTTIDASATTTGGGNSTGGNVTLTAAGAANTGTITTTATGGTATNGTVTINQTPTTSTTSTTFVSDRILDEQSEACQGENCGDRTLDNAPDHHALRHSDYPINSAYCRGETTRAVTAAEDYYSQEFASYLNLPQLPKILGSDQAQTMLKTIANQTGRDSAVVYMGFCPRANRPLEQQIEQQAHKQKPEEPRLPTIQEQIDEGDRLVLLLVQPGQDPIRHELNVSRNQVRDLGRRLRRTVANPNRRTAYLNPAQTLYSWILEPLEADLQAAGIDHLAYVPVPGLRTIPLAAMHDGTDFAIARYSLSLLPSLSLTNPTPQDLRQATVLAMGAETFATLPPLPAVPVELNWITPGLWPGEAHLNAAFTYKNLQQARRETSYPIVHLATHSQFQAGTPANSYIQLWDQQLSLDDIHRLDWQSPLVELLVLSACETAFGDADAELGFVGLSVSTGAKSAIGSLWTVSDMGTLGLMAQFYQELRSRDRAQALQQAQLAMSRAQIHIQDKQLQLSNQQSVGLSADLLNVAPSDFSHPFYWAAFTLVGSPW